MPKTTPPEDIGARAARAVLGGVGTTVAQALGGGLGQHAIDAAHKVVAAAHGNDVDKADPTASKLDAIAESVKITSDDRLPAIESKLGAIAESVRSSDDASAARAKTASAEAGAATKQREQLITTIKKGLGVDEYSYTKADKDDKADAGGGVGSWLKGGAEGIAERLGLTGLFGGLGRTVTSLIKGVVKGFGGALKLVGKAGLFVSLADGIVSGVQGFSKDSAKKLLGDDSLSSRYRSAAINLLSGMTFGIASPERIRDVTDKAADWMSRAIMGPIMSATGRAGDGWQAFTDYTEKAWLNMKTSVMTKLVIPMEKALDWIESKLGAINHARDVALDVVRHAAERVKQSVGAAARVATAGLEGGPLAAAKQAMVERQQMAALQTRQDAENTKRDHDYDQAGPARARAAQARIAAQQAALAKENSELDLQNAAHAKDRATNAKGYAADDAEAAAAWKSAAVASGPTVGEVIGATPGAIVAAKDDVNTVMGNVASGAYHMGHALTHNESQPAPADKSTDIGDSSSAADPGDRALLNAIAFGEANSDGYNTVYGRRGVNLTDMTTGQVMAYQSQMLADGAKSTAVGRYQFIDSTLARLVRKPGFSVDDKFDAATQDKLALSLLDEVGRQQLKAGGITMAQYQSGIATQWAAIADPVTGHGDYDDDGLNRYNPVATGMVNVALIGSMAGAPTSAVAVMATARPSSVPDVTSATPIATEIATPVAAPKDSAKKAAGVPLPTTGGGDMGDFLTLSSLPLLPTDPGLMAINTGAA